MSLLDIVSLWMRYLSSEEVVVFALCEKESNKLIGWLGFDEWDKENGVATFLWYWRSQHARQGLWQSSGIRVASIRIFRDAITQNTAYGFAIQ
jgi:RimJ/RimL family protein N-acetyltransferase